MIILVRQHLPEFHRQIDVRQAIGSGEKRGYLLVSETSYQAHCRDGIALTLQADTLPVDGAKMLQSKSRCATVVMASIIAAEDENLTRLQFGFGATVEKNLMAPWDEGWQFSVAFGLN